VWLSIKLAFLQGYLVFANIFLLIIFFLYIAPFVFKLICVEFYFLLFAVFLLLFRVGVASMNHVESKVVKR